MIHPKIKKKLFLYKEDEGSQQQNPEEATAPTKKERRNSLLNVQVGSVSIRKALSPSLRRKNNNKC